MIETNGAKRQAGIMAGLREATGTQTNPAADVLRAEISGLERSIKALKGAASDAAKTRLAALQESLKLITKGEPKN